MAFIWKPIGIAGLALIICGVVVRERRREDLLYIAGGALLLAYSVSIGDPIFVTLQAVFIGAAAYDLARMRLEEKGMPGRRRRASR